MLLERYVNNNKEVLFIMHGVSWKLLMVLNCTDSLSGKGLFIDAAEKGKKCVKLPIDYFKELFGNQSINQTTLEIDCISTKL